MYLKRIVFKKIYLCLGLLILPWFILVFTKYILVINKSTKNNIVPQLNYDEQMNNQTTKERYLSDIPADKTKFNAKGTKMNPVDVSYINLVGKHLMDLQQKITLPFLENFQNPCWFTKLPSNISNMYENNPLQYMNSDGLSHWMRKYGPIRQELINSEETVQLKCLPKVYLIGVHKSGTTDVFYKLAKHSQIFTGPKKEVHWWNNRRHGMRSNGTLHVPTFSDYIESFDNAALNIRNQCPGANDDDDYHSCLAIDGSIRLLWSSPFVERFHPNNPNLPPEEMLPAIIDKITPTAKLLVILREPVSRCYSKYFYTQNNKVKDPELFHRVAMSSLELLKNCIAENGSRYCAYDTVLLRKMEVELQPSMYYIFLKDWLKIWPREQVFVMELWEFSANRSAIFDQLTDFLNIERYPRDLASMWITKAPSNYNPASKNGEIWPETKKILSEFFQPYNDMLAGLLGDEKYRWK